MQLGPAVQINNGKRWVANLASARKAPFLNLIISKIISGTIKVVTFVNIFVNLHPLVAARPTFRPYPGWLLGTDQYPQDYKSRLVQKMRRLFWESIKKPCLIRWLNGLRVYVYPSTEISRAMFLTGYYEPNQFCLLNKILTSGMTFIDVGANIGLYTLFASKKVGEEGTVVAIEPSNREFQRLKMNSEANVLTNVRLLQVAISNSQTTAELLVATEENSGHNTLGAFGYDSVLPQGRERVRIERLDDIVQQERLQRVDVIKMDIEGAEFYALQGAADTLTQFRPVLLLELSDRTLEHQGCSSKRVWEYLTQAGYRIYGYDNESALPVPAQHNHYFDSENIVAVHECSSEQWLG